MFWPIKNITRAIRLFNEAFPRHGGRIALMAVLSFLSGVLEGVGVNAIIPLFSILRVSVSPTLDAVSRAIEQAFLFFHVPLSPSSLAAFIFALFIGKAILLFFVQYVMLRITARFEVNKRNELLGKLLRSDWAYLLRQKVGFLDQVLLSNINTSSGILFHLGAMILVLANLAVYTFLVVNISPLVAFVAVIFGAAVFVLARPAFSFLRRQTQKIVAGQKEIGHFINEHLIGMKTVKTAAVADALAHKGAEHFEHQRILRLKTQSLQNLVTVSFQPAAALFILFTLAYFVRFDTLNIASFAVVVYALNRVFVAVQGLQSEVQDIYGRLPHLSSVLQFQREVSAAAESSAGTRPFRFSRSIHFRDVHFNYEAGAHVLRGVTLAVQRGEIAALMGLSGAGKTTLVDLLLRLFQPTRGEILVDGAPIRDISIAEWRRSVGYVPQDVFLINGTIEDNIRFYDDTLSREAVLHAARQAQCYDFIMALPDGFNAPAGERGVLLSGGQRQRIALARALARKPSVLILDEATSALDHESESLIQIALQRLRGKMTVIAIAHRQSTVQSADTLFVMEDGVIVDEGRPDVVLARRGAAFASARA